jgi:hypothetical protein
MSANGAELQVRFDALKVRHVVERVFQGDTGSIDVRLWDGIVISPE